jgi:DNA invertase Pin-like site-specific DNA recombinase
MPSRTMDQAADLIRDRIRELEAETADLKRALSSLTDGREGRRGPGRPRGSGAGSSRSDGRKRGRRRNTRSDQAVKLIAANPGISASEIAKRLKIKPNYMYRVLGDLQKEGRVKQDGRSYTAA